ncbi:MAG TPA: L,D-transpeptidase [Ktedonobacteraceae bacterium]|jgi:hypothetical protein|nr:L,D-transpeptidase [Ktedonobacteraceae bacterium]
MQKSMKKLYTLIPIALSLALFMVLSSAQYSASAHTASAQRAAVAAGTLRGCTTDKTNVRTASFASARSAGVLVWGKDIVVSLSKQHLYAYDNGHEVNDFLIQSGRPSLATPLGTYHVFSKQSPTTFRSPFPKGSPDWYAPTHINYALEFKPGYFLHDAWWHSVFGPGTNLWHNDPQWGMQWGSHGCVGMPISDAAWLYQWAPYGTTVQIVP